MKTDGLQSKMRRAASGRPGTLSARLRQRRFEHVRGLLDSLAKPLTILDVGGTQGFWQTVGMSDQDDIEITILNLQPVQVTNPRMRAVIGNATSMPEFVDDQFDVVFSNSVIEHVGGIAAQRSMADEVRRIGRRYYVQTPNRYFPVEPHFLFPFFGVLPQSTRAFLLRHLALGWYSKIPDHETAARVAASIRLLTRLELLALFPDGRLVRERVAGLTKSFSVYGGDW